jgi:hypothetical protein
MLYSEHYRTIFLSIAVSFFIFLSFPSILHSQTSEPDAVFILRGSTKLQSGKAAERVDLELKKNGKTISKIFSAKNGKYSLEMEISILDRNSEYVLYISQVGTVPKSISINTYISPEEYSSNTFPNYIFDLEIKMIEKTGNDIIIEGPSGKIIWDNSQHAFTFDQSYAKIIRKKEDNPEKYLADKNRKQELEAARKKDEEARLKAEAEAAFLTEQKLKRDAEKDFETNAEAMKKNLIKKKYRDSIDSARGVNNSKINLALKNPVKEIFSDAVDQNAFDGTGMYSINIAKRSIKEIQEKMNKEKATNLSAKYETNNTLTSLLNMIDEDEKNNKNANKQQ